MKEKKTCTCGNNNNGDEVVHRKFKKCMNVELESVAWLVTLNFKVEPAQKNPIDLEQVKEKLKLWIHCYFTTGPGNTGLFTIILPVDHSYMKIYLYVVNPCKSP